MKGYTRQAARAILSGIPKALLLTPICATTGKRIVIHTEHVVNISREPGADYGIVKDLLTGKSFHLYARPCSLPHCHCDCTAIPLDDPDSPPEAA
jgi:hypothetical protein